MLVVLIGGFMLYIICRRGNGVTILYTSSWKEETVNVKTFEHLRESGVKFLENTPIITPEALKLKTLGIAEVVLNKYGYLEELRGSGNQRFNLSDVCRGLSTVHSTYRSVAIVGEWYLYIDDRFKLKGELPTISIAYDKNAKLILDLSKCTLSGALRIINDFGVIQGTLLVNAPVDDDVYYAYLLKYFDTEEINGVLPYFQEAFKPLTSRFLSDYLGMILDACDNIKAHRDRSLKFYKQGNIEIALWDVGMGCRRTFNMMLLINTIKLLKDNPNFPPSVLERVMKAVDSIFKA